MAYNVRPLASFERGLERLDKQIARRIIGKINSLADNPESIGRPMGGLPKDFAGLHKLRVGDWRVFFWVDHGNKELILYLVDHRDDIYKSLYRKNK